MSRQLARRVLIRSEQQFRAGAVFLLWGGSALPAQELPDIAITPPDQEGDTLATLANFKWLCLIILTGIATWRVVALGLAWSGGNPNGTRQSFIGLMGVLIAIYLLFNIGSVYNLVSQFIPF